MEIPSWFIAGKAVIWLGLPAAWGIWELMRHRRMMAADKAKALASDVDQQELKREDMRTAA
ncbi:MAG: hypothetical protein AAF580_01775 [Pseudomonadota bacterium]